VALCAICLDSGVDAWECPNGFVAFSVQYAMTDRSMRVALWLFLARLSAVTPAYAGPDEGIATLEREPQGYDLTVTEAAGGIRHPSRMSMRMVLAPPADPSVTGGGT
jgi:hypothetical protein